MRRAYLGRGGLIVLEKGVEWRGEERRGEEGVGLVEVAHLI